MKPIKIIINRGVYYKNLPQKAKIKIINNLSFDNPIYVNAKKYEKNISSLTMPTIPFFENSKKTYWTPRGYIYYFIKFCKKNKYKFIIEDRTLSFPALRIKFYGKLRDYQKPAVKDMLKYPVGVLKAPTGGGKTTMAIYLIAARKQPTLIIVHNKELFYQWEKAIKMFLHYQCGLLGDGNKKIKKVTVGIINSVNNNIDTLYNQFGFVIVDETHRVPSTIFTETVQEFTAKYVCGLSISENSVVSCKIKNKIYNCKIKDLYKSTQNTYAPKNMLVRCCVKGQFTWGKVQAFIRHKLKQKQMWKITTTVGRSIEMTEDHSAIIVKKGKLLDIKPTNLKIGDSFLIDSGFWGEKGIDTIKYFDLLPETKNFIVAGASISDIEAYTQTTPKSNRHRIRYKLKHGKYGNYVPASFYTKKCNFEGTVYCSGRGNEHSTLIDLNKIAFIAGYYAGNGSSKRGRMSIVCPTHKHKRIVKELNLLGFKPTIRNNGTSVELYVHSITFVSIIREITKGKAYSKRIHSCIFSASEKVKRAYIDGCIFSDGHIRESTRGRKRVFLSTYSKQLALDYDRLISSLGVYSSISLRKKGKGGIINGRQIIGKYDNYVINFSYHAYNKNNEVYHGKRTVTQMKTNGSVVKISKIEKIKYNKDSYVYDFSVPECENFVANGILCHNTATPYRRDGLGKGIFACIGPKLHIVSRHHLNKIKATLKPRIIRIQTGYYFFYTGEYPKLISDLTKNKERNNLIGSLAQRDFNKYNQSILIVSDRKAHCLEIQKSLSIPSLVLTSKSKGRKEIIKKMRTGECKILISTTSLIGEGFDLNILSALFITTPIKFSGRLIQICGRILRPNKGAQPRVYDFRDTNIGVLRNSGFVRDLIYKKLKW